MEALIAKDDLKQEFQWLIFGEPAPITMCYIYGRFHGLNTIDLDEHHFSITDDLEAKFELHLTREDIDRAFKEKFEQQRKPRDTVSRTGMVEIWGAVPKLQPMLICKRQVQC